MAKRLEVGEFKLTLKAVDPNTDTQSPFSHEVESNPDVKKIRGIASGTSIDLHNDIVTESTIKSFREAIENGVILKSGEWSYLPLRNGHGNNWDDILGWITKAEIDENHNLWIEAELDEDSHHAEQLYKKLTKPTLTGKVTELGLSIGGKIIKYRTQYDAQLQKSIRILESIRLGEISVVGAPALPTAFVEAITKSLDKLPDDYLLEDHMAEDNIEHRTAQEVPTEGKEDSIAIVIPESQNVENVDPATTARPDPSVNAPDILPSVDEQEANAEKEEVAPTNETETTEVAVTSEAQADPNAAMREALSALTQQVETLTALVNVTPDNTEDTVNKSADTSETDVEKSAPLFDMDTLKALIEGAVNDAVSKVTDELSIIKSAVEEMANEPVDKSLSVLKAKESINDNPLDVFKSQVTSENYNKKNILGDAVRASLATS